MGCLPARTTTVRTIMFHGELGFGEQRRDSRFIRQKLAPPDEPQKLLPALHYPRVRRPGGDLGACSCHVPEAAWFRVTTRGAAGRCPDPFSPGSALNAMVAMLKVSPATDLPSTGGWLGAGTGWTGIGCLTNVNGPRPRRRRGASARPRSSRSGVPPTSPPALPWHEQQKQAVADQVVTAGQIIHAVPFPLPTRCQSTVKPPCLSI